MIKKYNVTVDGKTYAVEVEDADNDRAVGVQKAANQSAPAVEPVPVVNSPVAAAPVVSEVPKVTNAAIKGETLRAPMPGTILSVSATVGQAVKRGDILLILEAMKMENEIVAHMDGTIAAILVQKGANVQAGDVLVAFA